MYSEYCSSQPCAGSVRSGVAMLFADKRALETNLQACIAAVARFRPTLIEPQGGLPTKKSSPRQLKPHQRPLRAPCSVVMRSGGTSHLLHPHDLVFFLRPGEPPQDPREGAPVLHTKLHCDRHSGANTECQLGQTSGIIPGDAWMFLIRWVFCQMLGVWHRATPPSCAPVVDYALGCAALAVGAALT